MAFVRKVWKNRISEFFNRYRLENVKTGALSTVYINLDDGAVEEQGDRLNAEALNDLEGRIAEAFENVGGSDDMIAGVESTSTSSQAYTVGQYLIYNKLLYKVTSAIAIGDTLAVGTNIIQKKIANEVSDHLVVSGNEFYFDYKDGEYGYNTSANRGADTFHPFKSGGGELQYKQIVSSTNWNSGSAGGSWTADKDYGQVRFIVLSGTNSSRSVSLTVAGVGVGLTGLGSTGYTKAGDYRISNLVEVKAGNVVSATTSGSESRVDCYCTMIYCE